MKHILTLTLAAAAFVLASPQAFSSNDDIKKMTVFVNATAFKNHRSRAVLKTETQNNKVTMYGCDILRKKPQGILKIKIDFCFRIGAHSKREEPHFKKYLPTQLGKTLFGSNVKERIGIVFHEEIPSEIYARYFFDAEWAIGDLRKAYLKYHKN